MKTLEFQVTIAAPPAVVWDTMLAQESYRLWTSLFAEGSRYEGSWATGERIRFLGPDGDGMVARIAECRPHHVVSIEHLGIIKDGIEDTTSDEVKRWTPAFETYYFRPIGDATELRVTMDTTPDYEDYFVKTWPQALAKLTELSERAAGGAEGAGSGTDRGDR